MSSSESRSEITPQELERDHLKKRLENITSYSFEGAVATPRPAEPTKVNVDEFIASHADLLQAVFDNIPALTSMLPDKTIIKEGPGTTVTIELIDQILTIIKDRGLLQGVEDGLPGFAESIEPFMPIDNQRATLDAITALQAVAIISGQKKINELYKPETHDYTSYTATGENRRSVRTGYSPRKDGITLTDRYAYVFEVNKTNTITIEGKAINYGQIDAVLLSNPSKFYDIFEKVNANAEVTDEMVQRLLTYVSTKINTPDFWNIKDDDDKAELQGLLSQLEGATENDEKKRLFGTIMNRLFKNNDISVELAAMASGGDTLAAGMPVQNRLQEWGRIVFGNETHGADQDTTALSREATIDLRSAQALFNTLISPEDLKVLYLTDRHVAQLRKKYDDEIEAVSAKQLNDANRKKELDDIYRRMTRDDEINQAVQSLTHLRSTYYQAILAVYNVENADGSKTGASADPQLEDRIRKRKSLLKGKDWKMVSQESEKELLREFNDRNDPGGAIRSKIETDRDNTQKALARLEKRFGPDFIKNNRAGNDVVVSMGLKGIELLQRRALTGRKTMTETLEHDLDAIMKRTLPSEVIVYGKVEEGAKPQEADDKLAELLERLELPVDAAPPEAPAEPEEERAASPEPPAERTDETDIMPDVVKLFTGEIQEDANGQSRSDANEESDDTRPDNPQAAPSEAEEIAVLFENQYHKLPQSADAESSAAVEAAIGLMNEGNLDESVDWFRRALDHDPANLQAMYGIAVTSTDTAEQIAMLEHILSQEPNFKVGRRFLSNLRSEMPGEIPPSASEDAAHPNAAYIEIAQLMKDPTPDNQRKARELAEQLTKANKDDAEAWFLRAALIRGKDKNATDAKKKHLKRVLKIDPNHQMAQEMLSKLNTESSAPIEPPHGEHTVMHPLLNRIEKSKLNTLAQENYEVVKESTSIDFWIEQRLGNQIIETLITSNDPANSELNRLQRDIEKKANQFALEMEQSENEEAWPQNKHTESVRIIQDIMLYEIKLKVDQYRQTHQESQQTPERDVKKLPYSERINEAILSGEALYVISHEIQQAFIDNDKEKINEYLSAARDILSVDSTTLPDYDNRHFDQIRTEGIKAMYLQILNAAIQNRSHKELFIEHIDQHSVDTLFASVLQEDMSQLSPTQVKEADYNNLSARLFGAAAKMEVMELLLKITTPKYLPITARLFAEGTSIKTALEHISSMKPSSSPETVIGELEVQLQDTSKKIQSFVEKYMIKTQGQAVPASEQQANIEQENIPGIEEVIAAIQEHNLLTNIDVELLAATITDKTSYDFNIQQIVKDILPRVRKLMPRYTVNGDILEAALSEMIKRQEEPQTATQAPAEAATPTKEALMDLETTITVLRDNGTTDASLDMLAHSVNDAALNTEIDYILTNMMIPVLKTAKETGKIPAGLTFNRKSLTEAMHEMVRRYKDQQPVEEPPAPSETTTPTKKKRNIGRM